VAEPGAAAPEMRWWGWGTDDAARPLPAHARAFLAEHVGVAERPREPVELEQVQIEPSRLPQDAAAALAAVVGGEGVRTDHRERVLHAAGKGYPDLVRLREGRPDGAPDAVVHPREHEQVAALLARCAELSLAVVPFGGGTSVVGGLAPLRGAHRAVVAVEMRGLSGLVSLDEQSATVTVGAGTRAPALERILAGHGLTLGHYPQSYEFVSLGGCAATRSAGQASTGYGAIEKMVLGMRLAAPAGEIALPPLPATAAGPGMRGLLVGSEGTLGVITELAMRVRRAPAASAYDGVFFTDFATGCEALRTLARSHALPDVARLSDEAETRMSMALAGGDGLKNRLGRAYLGARGYSGGCLAIVGFDGDRHEVAARRRRALRLIRRAGGLVVGSSPGEAWRHGRFAAPYLRDELLGAGVMVETLETATQWSNLLRLREAVARAIADALAAQGTPGLVMCHVSHVYETGASLYYTFLARQREGEEIEQWRTVKRAASDAIAANGGTITHHHAVGVDHAPWMEREIGALGVQALAAVKQRLDPAGIMNPGKLLAA
jgi:alkyldihydroxyacetonephosphate synthase